MPTSMLETALRLIMAMVVGGIVGLEREMHDRPAGLRTHILVCVGAALIMLISMEVPRYYIGVQESDPARIAAQVVSGIGFLGAGTILREGVTVRGLTTAASLWMVAALGLAAGAGLYLQGLLAAAITLISLRLLSRLDVYTTLKKNTLQLRVVARDRPGLLGETGEVLGRLGVNITNVQMQERDHGMVELVFNTECPRAMERMELLEGLENTEGVKLVEITGGSDPADRQ